MDKNKVTAESSEKKIETTVTEETADKTTDAVPETDVVADLTKKYEETNDKYLRLAAEFENYQKRTKREQEKSLRYATEKFSLNMLEVLDNFERALKSEDENLREGLEQIHKMFLGIFAKNGIEPMNTKGVQFDPNFHEAVLALPSDKPAGEILDVVLPGYMIHDKVLRHAKVAVSETKEGGKKLCQK